MEESLSMEKGSGKGGLYPSWNVPHGQIQKRKDRRFGWNVEISMASRHLENGSTAGERGRQEGKTETSRSKKQHAEKRTAVCRGLTQATFSIPRGGTEHVKEGHGR